MFAVVCCNFDFYGVLNHSECLGSEWVYQTIFPVSGQLFALTKFRD